MKPDLMLLSLCVSGLLGLSRPVLADEIRLKDGRVLVGKVTERGDVLEVETRDGLVRINRSEFDPECWRKDDVLRQRLAETSRGQPDTPFAHLNLASLARDMGLAPEMWRHLDAALQLPRNDENAALNARTDDFLARLEPELLPRKWRTAKTEVRVRELLARLRSNDAPAVRAALVELLRREPSADQELRAAARRNNDPQRRLLAVEALLRRGTAGSDSFAWRTSILDPDERVRAQAIDLVVANKAAEGAVQYMAPGLMHSAPEVRIRTAEAYAALDDGAAIRLLVAAGPNAGKALAAADPGVRAHVAFLNQQAYIRDFNVEVASASFIADPVIGTLQSGVVLDVTVQGVYEQQIRIVRVYRKSLKRLAGSDPGEQPRDWVAWLQRLQLPAAPAAVTPARSSSK